MDVISIVVTALVSATCGTVVTAIFAGLKRSKAKAQAVEDGLQSLLRAEIVRQHDKYTEKGYCPIYAKDALQREYEAYHNLGGNGVITELYNELLSLPEAPHSK